MSFMSSTVKNIIYNALYQVFIIALPLITIPYVSRVLGVGNLGINSYVTSVGIALSVVILMGLNQVGVRSIANAHDDKLLLKTFRGLWLLQLLMGIVVCLIYLLGLVSIFPYKFYFILELPYLLSYIIDISWFYIGIGKLQNVIIRNTIIKLISVMCIFLLVKSSSDLYIYILANSLGQFIANFLFWLPLLKKFGKRVFHFKWIESRPFLKNNISVMIPLVAVQLYTNLDSTLVGTLSNTIQLSFYDQSQKIARTVIALLNSATMVLMPKMVKNRNNKDSFWKIFKISLDGTLCLSLIFMGIIIVNAAEFVPWFFGQNFKPMILNMMIVSFIIPFISYGGVFANQYSISEGLYKEFSIPYYFGAVFSIAMNFVLVPYMGSIGGTIVITVTEFYVCFLRMFLVRKRIDWKKLLSGEWKFVIALLITCFSMTLVHFNIGSVFLNLAMKSSIMFMEYVLLLLIMKDNFIFTMMLKLIKKH